MKRAKIDKPAQTAMQSGEGNSKKWLLEFDTQNSGVSPLMGWTSSKDMMSEVSNVQQIGIELRHRLSEFVTSPDKNGIYWITWKDQSYLWKMMKN